MFATRCTPSRRSVQTGDISFNGPMTSSQLTLHHHCVSNITLTGYWAALKLNWNSGRRGRGESIPCRADIRSRRYPCWAPVATGARRYPRSPTSVRAPISAHADILAGPRAISVRDDIRARLNSCEARQCAPILLWAPVDFRGLVYIDKYTYVYAKAIFEQV